MYLYEENIFFSFFVVLVSFYFVSLLSNFFTLSIYRSSFQPFTLVLFVNFFTISSVFIKIIFPWLWIDLILFLNFLVNLSIFVLPISCYKSNFDDLYSLGLRFLVVSHLSNLNVKKMVTTPLKICTFICFRISFLTRTILIIPFKLSWASLSSLRSKAICFIFFHFMSPFPASSCFTPRYVFLDLPPDFFSLVLFVNFSYHWISSSLFRYRNHLNHSSLWFYFFLLLVSCVDIISHFVNFCFSVFLAEECVYMYGENIPLLILVPVPCPFSKLLLILCCFISSVISSSQVLLRSMYF